jgi:L,D-transpeptidase catalytic domain
MSKQKKNFIFLMAALIAVVPVFSQASYASYKVSSSKNHGKKSAKGYPDYSILTNSPAQSFYSPSTALYTLSPVNTIAVKTRKEKKYFAAGNAKKTNRVIVAANNNEASGNTREINRDNDVIAKNKKEIVQEDMATRFIRTSFTYPENAKADIGINKFPESELILYAKALKQYAKKNGYDTSYAFLSNMGMLCNKKRFFVVNLVTMEIEQSGLVSHGRGQGPSIFDKQYSNAAGSRCTSLGRYKILDKYKGSYGESYRMMGLDSSNQNAFNRNIVLHSMNSIPDIDGLIPACVSDGCPAVSVNFLASLRKIITTAKKPVLLWIFDSNLEEAMIREQPLKAEPSRVDVAVNDNPPFYRRSSDRFQPDELPK